MLEDKKINMRMAEKEDVPLLAQWFNSADFADNYQHFPEQVTRIQLEKQIIEHKNHENERVSACPNNISSQQTLEKLDSTKKKNCPALFRVQKVNGQTITGRLDEGRVG
jgi:hypothetical protein